MEHQTGTRRIRVAVLDAMRIDNDLPEIVLRELDAITDQLKDNPGSIDPAPAASYLAALWGEDYDD